MSKWATLHRIDGLYVGMLDEDEMKVFAEACKTQDAYRSFEYPGGALGLAKVRLRSASQMSPANRVIP